MRVLAVSFILLIFFKIMTPLFAQLHEGGRVGWLKGMRPAKTKYGASG